MGIAGTSIWELSSGVSFSTADRMLIYMSLWTVVINISLGQAAVIHFFIFFLVCPN